MAPRALRRFALAAFFTFSVIGLVSVLIESSVRVFPWMFVVLQAISYGAMAGTIVHSSRHWLQVLSRGYPGASPDAGQARN